MKENDGAEDLQEGPLGDRIYEMAEEVPEAVEVQENAPPGHSHCVLSLQWK